MLLNLSYKMLTAMIVQVIVSPCEPSHDWIAKIFQHDPFWLIEIKTFMGSGVF